jgi:uncharacterized protein (DUF3820 family)
MTSTAIVSRETGEIMEVKTFDLPSYLATISTPGALDHQQKLAHAYDAACRALIGPNDVQKEGAREFKKKSAWRKLQRHFNISTEVRHIAKEWLTTTDAQFCATVTVRAVAPWGQSAEAVGACATDEETGRRKITIADAIATAETRATNRAVSNLIAMGEVSAEEMTKSGPPKTAGDKLMPFGKHKGERLADVPRADLESTVVWCEQKDAKKFADLIAACREVLSPIDEVPAALEGGEDDLPF